MTRTSRLVGAAGLAMAIAGLLYAPLPFIDGWIGAPAIGGRNWWIVYHMATIHHFFLLFGLLGLLAVFAGWPGNAGRVAIGAFVVASLGNALVAGVGMIQTTVLPALAAHPEGQAAIDCTGFYRPATRSAAGFIEAACTDWHFEVLGAWVATAWLTLLAGGIAVGASIALGRGLPRLAGAALAVGYTVTLASFFLPIPEAAASYALSVVGIGYVWCGAALWRRRG